MRRIYLSAYIDVFFLVFTVGLWFLLKDTGYEPVCAVLVIVSTCILGLTLLSNNDPWLKKRK